MPIADWPITYPFFIGPQFIVYSVSVSNLGKNSGLLCIRLGNLQFTSFYKNYENLKRIGYPNLFP